MIIVKIIVSKIMTNNNNGNVCWSLSVVAYLCITCLELPGWTNMHPNLRAHCAFIGMILDIYIYSKNNF